LIKIREKIYCKKCGNEITKYSKSGFCVKCKNIGNRKEFIRPPKEELEELLNNNTFCEVGKKYGVSHTTIRRWLRK
jgi:hypothetical protein